LAKYNFYELLHLPKGAPFNFCFIPPQGVRELLNRHLFITPESLMKKILLKSAALSFVFVAISSAQTMPLDTVIQKLSATYDKITSYSADAVIYKYYCS